MCVFRNGLKLLLQPRVINAAANHLTFQAHDRVEERSRENMFLTPPPSPSALNYFHVPNGRQVV